MEIDLVPSWVLAKLDLPAEQRRHLAFLLSALLIPLLVPLALYAPHFCLFRFFLGIPCPGCGVLHSIVAALRLNWSAAWRSNPAGIGLLLLFGLEIVARAVALRRAGTSNAVNRLCSHTATAVFGWLLFVWIERILTGGIHGSSFLSKM